jgi:hypothetical protein
VRRSTDGVAALPLHSDLTPRSPRASAQKETRRREVFAGAFLKAVKAQ